jgi:hypothetical protein
MPIDVPGSFLPTLALIPVFLFNKSTLGQFSYLPYEAPF